MDKPTLPGETYTKFGAKIKVRFMCSHKYYTDHLSHCYSQFLVVNAQIYPAKSFNFSEKLYEINKLQNFKDFSRPNKEIKYFSRTLPKFNDFSRRLLKFKTFSRLCKPCYIWNWIYFLVQCHSIYKKSDPVLPGGRGAFFWISTTATLVFWSCRLLLNKKL